jgi:hypothetical protein
MFTCCVLAPTACPRSAKKCVTFSDGTAGLIFYPKSWVVLSQSLLDFVGMLLKIYTEKSASF